MAFFMESIKQHIEQALAAIPNHSEKIFLLAVSGGVDSMVLMHVFNSLGLKYKVAHCNFNLRGEDSIGDEKLVRTEAAKFNVDFFCESFDVESYKKEQKCSTQMAARDLRYNWFEGLLKEHKFHYLVTAHHLNDNIETVLLNLTRGTGIKGVTGMELLSKNVLRPMLSVSKKSILDYSSVNNVEFRNDVSNASNDYSRNKIRNLVIPLLEELNPGLDQTMANNIANLNVVNDVYQSAIEKELSNGMISTKNELYFVDIPKLKQLKNTKNTLFEWLFRFGFNYSIVSQLYTSVIQGNGTGKQFISDSNKILIDRDRLVMSPINFIDSDSVYINKLDKNVTYPIELSLNHLPKESVDIKKESNFAYLDEGKLIYPLELRKWRNGDVFQPFGMVGKKKVSDYLIDNKVSQFDKEKTFVLLSNNEIVWLVGHRSSEKYKISSSAKTILTIKLDEGNGKYDNKKD
jgi:tRNA(Ile)-lysidine synthase